MLKLQTILFHKISIFILMFCFINASSEALEYSTSPQIAIDAQGNVATVWQSLDSLSGNNVIEFRYYDSLSTTWSTEIIVSDPLLNSYTPSLAINGKGDLVIVWISSDVDGISSLYASIKLFQEAVSAPTRVSLTTSLTMDAYSMDVNNNGDIVVSWTGFFPPTYTSVVRETRGNLDGTWQAPRTLSN